LVRDLQRGPVGLDRTRRITLAPQLDAARIEAPCLLAAIALPRALPPLRLPRPETVDRSAGGGAGSRLDRARGGMDG
jgi:hypothetical protein